MSIVVGNNLVDRIITGDQSDSIFGFDGNDVIESGGGDDVVFGGDGIDIIKGGDGNDVLRGGADADIIFGGDGNDVIFGGAGADTLEGGAGADTFVFDFADKALVDEITDFNSGEDVIFIQGAGDNANVAYNANTGIVTVNGEEFIQLDTGLTVDGDDFLLC